jgi:hypothetical protein
MYHYYEALDTQQIILLGYWWEVKEKSDRHHQFVPCKCVFELSSVILHIRLLDMTCQSLQQVLSKPHLYQIITMHSANTDSRNTVSPEVCLFATSVGLANPRSQGFHFSRTF